MTDTQFGLLAMFALITAGDQIRLTRRAWDRNPGPSAILGSAYGLLALIGTGNWGTGIMVAVSVAVTAMLAGILIRRRGPNGVTGIAVVATSYLGVWLAWVTTNPALRPGVHRFIDHVWERVTFGDGGHAASLAHALVLAAAYLFCWGTATYLTRAVLTLDPLGDAPPPELGAYQGGRIIGALERMLALTLALTNNFAAIGFVVAAKSLVRLDFARERGEYFLVGTLTSIGLAVGTGLLCLRLLTG